MLLEDGELRGRMGRQARIAAETRLSRERFLAETLAVYESALASKG